MANHGIVIGDRGRGHCGCRTGRLFEQQIQHRGTSTSAPAAGGNKVLIDGQAQNVTGQVSCTQVNGNLSIGIGDPTTGIGAVVTNADPPVVQAVGLGNLTGVTLGYSGRRAEPGQRAGHQKRQLVHD